MANSQILDIRVHDGHDPTHHACLLRDDVLEGFAQQAGSKRLPTLLLYDERGLRLYDDITTEAPEYYLFGAEEEILKQHGDEIAQVMHSGRRVEAPEVVLELGAGALRKTSHILLALSHLVDGNSTREAPITYYALDLEERELHRTLNELSRSEIGVQLRGKVDTKGLWGTYDSGLKYVAHGGLRGRHFGAHSSTTLSQKLLAERVLRDESPESTSSAQTSASSLYNSTQPSTPGQSNSQPPLHIMFLGSSVGNFDRKGAADFLRSLPLRAGSEDTLLLGLDHHNEQQKILTAYNDPKGYTRKFIMNGLKAAGKALGDESLFDEDNWEYVNTYDVNERRHEAFFKSKKDQSINGPDGKVFKMDVGEMVKIEESLKFSETDAYSLFTEANLRPIQRWTDTTSSYSLWLLERPQFAFPLLSSPITTSTAFGVPSVDDWKDMWACWSFITLRMIPPSMLFQKPIDLRHICLFYLGHIPAFLDIHMSRLLGQPHTEPTYFKDIFERGIDPDVDDPTKCHDHSEVPQNEEDWPTLDAILSFQARVRDRVLNLYRDIQEGRVILTRKMARVLFMTWEHEAMHAETLLYMLVQRAGSGTIPPSGFMPPAWESLAQSWDAVPAPVSSTVTLGPATVTLGHDDFEEEDEKPYAADDVETHEFGWDNESPKREVHVDEFRISFRPVTNGQFLDFYREWNDDPKVTFPASWVETDGDTMVRSPYGPVPMKIAHDWPIMTSYNNLSVYAMVQGGRLPTEPELRLFMDKFECGYEGGANVGFRNWHPIPATAGGAKDGGRGHNGGVWEWTSTLFDRYDGFKPSKLYPGYSADFFDGAHQTVLGGSYATVPRLAGRRSFRNWYQRNYEYPWVGARVVCDVESPA